MKKPADFEKGDDLSDMLGTPSAPRDLPQSPEFARIRAEVPEFTERCKSCGGSGLFTSWSGRQLGPCFKCKGKGSFTFRTSPQERAAARDARARRQQQAVEAFSAQYPAEMAWINIQAPTFEFAAKMRDALATYGELTENQLATVQRLTARDQERKTQRQAETAARSTAIDCSKIAAAFASAKSKGIKRPKLIVGSLRFSLAPDHGRNAGAIYVKGAGEQYLGKITGATFQPVREATADQVNEVVTLAADPLEAAKAHGRMTGQCSCCGRELTDPESIRLGIGPICAEKYGF